MRLTIIKSPLYILLAALILSGCTAAFLNTAARGIFPQDDTNFTQQNYAVADYLIQQGRSYIKTSDIIVAEPLKDTMQPNMSSDLSKSVPEQIGIRLSQLGYTLDLSNVASEDAKASNMMGALGDPDFILSGVFTRRRLEMDVSMRITEVDSGRVVAVFDYVMPLTREVAKMAEPQPKIIRMTPQQ